MRLLTAALVAFCTVVAPVPAVDAATVPPVVVDPGWVTYSDADSDMDAALGGLDLAVDELAGNGVGSGSGCRAGSRTNHASIKYSDAAGLPTFAFFSTITWSSDCRKVTALSQVLRAEVYQPQYRFVGYVHRNVSPVGQKTATASAQARFGICQSAAGETCVLERLPTIAWKVYANGKATTKTTP